MVANRIEHDWDQMYAADAPPPWGIGEPQPALAALLDRIDIADPVLDVGCGTGELAIHLAGQGHRVVGIDGSPVGIEKARSNAAGLGREIAFLVADATRLDELELRPRTVVDSGLLHCLDDDAQLAYVAGLEAICEAGALVCVVAMSAEAGLGWGVTREELARAFPEPGWSASTIEPVEILAVVDGEQVYLAAFLLMTSRA